MNKKILKISLIPLLLSLWHANANEVTFLKIPEIVAAKTPKQDTAQNTPSNDLKNSVQIRTDAFFPSAHRFREIYGSVGPSYEIEASRKFNSFIDGWVNFDWFYKSGEGKGCHTKTHINIANGSFGIKFVYQFSKPVGIYLGLGPTFGGVWVKNESHCGHEKISKFAFGGILKSGFTFSLSKHVFLDLFADYFYQPVHFEHHVNIGGVRTGLGLGYKF